MRTYSVIATIRIYRFFPLPEDFWLMYKLMYIAPNVLQGDCKMASIGKRNNRWEVRIRRHNQPIHCKILTLKADAQYRAGEEELALERQSINSQPCSHDSPLSLAINWYISEHLNRHKGRESAIYRLGHILNALGTSNLQWHRKLPQPTTKQSFNWICSAWTFAYFRSV